MRVAASRAQGKRRAKTIGLVLLSAALHVAMLGALAIRMPVAVAHVDAPAVEVSLVPAAWIVRAQPAAHVPTIRSTQPHVVETDIAPRYADAPVQAATGEAADAVDLFGPVFADGLWPRPVRVRRPACEAGDDNAAAEDCRRDAVLIGLASEPSRVQIRAP
ncbi:MAG: hypothetical protein JF588_20825 [Caulobacterales bacterium]|nr:hypothetical protein [Caulobacterales bacterium]